MMGLIKLCPKSVCNLYQSRNRASNINFPHSNLLTQAPISTLDLPGVGDSVDLTSHLISYPSLRVIPQTETSVQPHLRLPLPQYQYVNHRTREFPQTLLSIILQDRIIQSPIHKELFNPIKPGTRNQISNRIRPGMCQIPSVISLMNNLLLTYL